MSTTATEAPPTLEEYAEVSREYAVVMDRFSECLRTRESLADVPRSHVDGAYQVLTYVTVLLRAGRENGYDAPELAEAHAALSGELRRLRRSRGDAFADISARLAAARHHMRRFRAHCVRERARRRPDVVHAPRRAPASSGRPRGRAATGGSSSRGDPPGDSDPDLADGGAL